ncbi:hypothetical protein D3C87_2058670 [compost metagenome]
MPSSLTSASSPNFLAMPTFRILAVAWPDGQFGMAITRSAPVAGSATDAASMAASTAGRNLDFSFTIPSGLEQSMRMTS